MTKSQLIYAVRKAKKAWSESDKTSEKSRTLWLKWVKLSDKLDESAVRQGDKIEPG